MSITATATPPAVITAKTVKRRFIVTANVATDAYGKTSDVRGQMKLGIV